MLNIIVSFFYNWICKTLWTASEWNLWLNTSATVFHCNTRCSLKGNTHNQCIMHVLHNHCFLCQDTLKQCFYIHHCQKRLPLLSLFNVVVKRLMFLFSAVAIKADKQQSLRTFKVNSMETLKGEGKRKQSSALHAQSGEVLCSVKINLYRTQNNLVFLIS